MNIVYTHTISQIGDYLYESFQNALQKSPHITIALSGGNTPKALFEYWVKAYKHSKIWHNISYYWVDERCVAPDNTESNYGVAFSLFFEPLTIPHQHIYRMQGEQNPQKEALRYHALLQHINQNNGIPQFDFILLGIGDDGHTASIFPGNENLFFIPQFVVNTKNPYTQQNRLTITGSVINNAKHVMFIVTGESKRNIVQEIIHPTRVTYPAHYVKPINGQLILLTDIQL
ncbi:MAG TPA: 6-phosphogluconolactonase [Bacteroidales bacterium]|nr:6-phosphogluconolactonase [Bacteroidales bacterium]